MANDPQLGTTQQKRDRELIPRVLVRAMVTLCLSVLAIAGYARLTDRPLAASPPSLEEAPIVAEQHIQIYSETSGAVIVTDADGIQLLDLAAGDAGALPSIYRVLERRRGARGIDASDPIQLVRYSAHRIGLRDELTGATLELMGFGTNNLRHLSALLEE